MSIGGTDAVINTRSTSSSGTGAASSTSSAAAKAATVDYQQFLRLLVAELKNQDPTNPTDPTQFMSQLASFSSVEQLVRSNSTLDALLAAQANSVIGRTVTSADGLISGTVVAVQTSAGGGATVTLSDDRTVTLGAGVTVSAS
jgi:flagellar basal-body rod modification protein FlgD